ncbi:PRC and DUF2382 domain-containing protein (plasmid) [Rhodococcus antarcticus]|jgi:uncharacterized protein (TIGR02271 family)|uniref:PRC and DUF2382 domain-containing protein n=1 Tax=Rhodococcus antarcticus TaxID=2987751 RepID=A0ABY6P5X4_9NOCA|nr:PRC and DUF2382 domain-containing protein [Rhodococcus antarcticus]UZJ27047.1 PRC and DUF2382 domain-containing protein [Rhodococcus antarcticus]
MISVNEIDTIAAGHVYDTAGDKVGSVGQVYLDNESGEPEWVTVKTGLFGGKASFVPLARATVQGGDVHVPFDKDKIKDAPRVDADGELSPAEEDELYTYYGMSGGRDQATDTGSGHTDPNSHGMVDAQADATAGPVGGTDTRTDRTDTQGHDTSGPNTDQAMTRSEEQLNVGTRTEEAGRARLRKHVVTEQQTVTVPVSHEEVTIEREPITEATRGDALNGADITEEQHEVTLHAERPVVEKETVPVERIKVGTETVTGQETVTDSVRKEQVELDDHTTGHRDSQR